ncbi:hypothetical protein BPY_23130 [Bifidobacterium psychraerophilum]|uniref:hypothetical protein n=1 Tax=Bifidobacterium psychraerophilum TaxID=218140 RepID=UPI003116AEB2
MSAYEEMRRVFQKIQETPAGQFYDPPDGELPIDLLEKASIAEDLHRIADALEPLNTMGDFNRNMGELREFFKGKATK